MVFIKTSIFKDFKPVVVKRPHSPATDFLRTDTEMDVNERQIPLKGP